MIPAIREVGDNRLVGIPQRSGGVVTLTATSLLDCLGAVCEAIGKPVQVEHPALDLVMDAEPGHDSLVDLIQDVECRRREWRGWYG